MPRLLIISPHFPPDSSAGSHRVRLLAPYLPDFGWEPTVLTVDPRDYETRLDPDLSALVPESLRVIRARALPHRWTRIVRVGDLGLRAFPFLLRAARKLLRDEAFACLFVTIFPVYTALLGPLLKRKASLRFVLDYQDPWVGSWGKSSGPGLDGAPDLKSRLSRVIGEHLEPRAVRAADALTAVSEETYNEVRRRIPEARRLPCIEIPLGGEARDFEFVRRQPRAHRYFTPDDAQFHLSYVGTLLPKGFETLDCFLDALLRLKREEPRLFAKVRVHFLGTSNQFASDAPARVLPHARERGLEEMIQEAPARIDYLEALTVLRQSSAILLLGSSERHYTASKIYPALLARKPLLAAYHEESSVVPLLRGMGSASIQLVTFTEERPVSTQSEVMYQALLGILKQTQSVPEEAEGKALEAYSARSMARRLCTLLDTMVQPP